MNCITPGLPVYHQLPGFTQTHVHQVSDAIQPSHPLSSPSPPALNLSQHQGLSQWLGFSHQVDKVLELQLQHRPSNKYSGLISFRMDWLDLLAVQGTLKSLPQHHCSKASNYSALSILYYSTLTSIHDYWKDHSFDYGPLSAKWCLHFLICCLGFLQLFFQGANVFWFHGCSHYLQWFLSPRK